MNFVKILEIILTFRKILDQIYSVKVIIWVFQNKKQWFTKFIWDIYYPSSLSAKFHIFTNLFAIFKTPVKVLKLVLGSSQLKPKP